MEHSSSWQKKVAEADMQMSTRLPARLPVDSDKQTQASATAVLKRSLEIPDRFRPLPLLEFGSLRRRGYIVR